MNSTDAMPVRVFLSHTSELGRADEPGSFVAAAVEAVLRARHAITDMAYFAARDTSPAVTCIEMVRQSDVYVGIIGLRYGSLVRDRPDVSYTKLEFEAATEYGLPRLIFLLGEDSAVARTTAESPDRRAQQDAFRGRLRDSELTVVRIGTPAELKLAVYQALVELGPAPFRPRPRPRPLPLPSRRVTLGRDPELAQVAANLLADPPLPTVILGAPGIGKTNLALAALHHPDVANRYERRLFVRCDGAASASDIVVELARTLSLPLVGTNLLAKCIVALTRGRAIICLDNAETPWEKDTTPCEQLFDALAGASALLISMRGTERPGGPTWSLPLRLTPLGREQSRSLFLSLAGEEFDQPGLDTLLDEMGGVPLAVELLANAADDEASIGDLAERWRVERVRLLERGSADHRLLSVAVSIEASWSGPLMTMSARRLLSLLGNLVDGLAHADLEAVLPDEGLRAGRVLRRRGLAFDEAGRLRTAPPVRHHINVAHPPDPADWDRVIVRYRQLAHHLEIDLPLGRHHVKALPVQEIVRPEVRVLIREASVICGIDPQHGNRAPFYGRAVLEEIVRSKVPRRLTGLWFALDFSNRTAELEYLCAAVTVLKGSCDYEGSKE